MKVALVYDRVNKWGGAERVLLALNKLFPDAPLYTSVYNPKTAPWAKVFPKVISSFLQNFPYATRHEPYATLMPLAFESFDFDEYDLVISITSEAAKGIITKPKTLHICYCLTPTRYLWSGYDEYFKNSILRFFSKPLVSYLQSWDKKAAYRPDLYIAVSKEVQRRIKKYYGRESKLIYPPMTLIADSAWHVDKKTTRQKPRATSYFLVVSRLVPYKRIDIAVEAFNKLGWSLKVIGTGLEGKRLKSLAKKNIEFLDNLTDEQLISYYENCLALVFPGNEDFGLTILEAQSFGKPVIAFKGGGALETVVEGKTGLFFDHQTAYELMKALRDFDRSKFNSKDCIAQAQKFNEKVFKQQFMSLIEKLI